MKILFVLALFSVVSCSRKEKTESFKQPDLTPKDTVAAKNTDHNFDILKFLLDKEIGSENPEKVDYKNYSVSFDNDGDSYSVYFSKIATEDFNKDGIQDYIIERNSEGMLGGSANTESEIIYAIMGKDNKVQRKHTILTYAPFSYNTLDDIVYKDGILKADATQNSRTYYKPPQELESTELSFVYKNENVYEESYLSNCELAKWKDKKVLNNVSESFRTIEMHNYTEVLNEKLTTDNFECTVEVSGCDNLSLIAEGTYKMSDLSEKNIDSKRKQFLDFLVKNTSLSEDFKMVQNHYLTDDLSEEYIKKGFLSFKLFTDKGKGKVHFRLVLDKNTNSNQTENWEITTRKK